MTSTYPAFITEVTNALESAGFTNATEPRSNTLLNASRGNFDGSFLLRAETGGEPFPQASLSPRHFKQTITLEIATEIKTSLVDADILVEERAAKAYKAIFYTNFASGGSFYGWGTPRKQRDLEGKRIVWAVTLQTRWVNPV
jgi:hypothetical protein